MVGVVYSWYNEIPYHLGGWPTTREQLYHRSSPTGEFLAPHQAPQPRGLASGGGAPRVFGFEGQQSLIAAAPQDWGKQRLHSWRVHTRFHMHQDLGQKWWLGTWARPTCWSWRVSWGRGDGCSSPWGHGHQRCRQRYQRMSSTCTLIEGGHLAWVISTQDLAPPNSL